MDTTDLDETRLTTLLGTGANPGVPDAVLHEVLRRGRRRRAGRRAAAAVVGAATALTVAVVALVARPATHQGQPATSHLTATPSPTSTAMPLELRVSDWIDHLKLGELVTAGLGPIAELDGAAISWRPGSRVEQPKEWSRGTSPNGRIGSVIGLLPTSARSATATLADGSTVTLVLTRVEPHMVVAWGSWTRKGSAEDAVEARWTDSEGRTRVAASGGLPTSGVSQR